jgi:protein-tyrosine phosphatase
MNRVIFVCSANYYRSRFAEHLFNWLAEHASLAWRAKSRGLLVGQYGNLGSISHYTVDALADRGIPMEGEHREPKPLTHSDLASADIVVAVKEREHRAPMVEQFPEWADRVIYWSIDDLDFAQPDEALPLLEEHVRRLVEDLQAAGPRKRAV